jgi:hypothetical protein
MANWITSDRRLFAKNILSLRIPLFLDRMPDILTIRTEKLDMRVWSRTHIPPLAARSFSLTQ